MSCIQSCEKKHAELFCGLIFFLYVTPEKNTQCAQLTIVGSVLSQIEGLGVKLLIVYKKKLLSNSNRIVLFAGSNQLQVATQSSI